MSSVHAACTPTDWPKDSQKYDMYTNEEGMYELLFSSQQPKAKDFRRHCFNVLFPRARQQLSDKLHAMEIEDLTSRIQALEFTNEEEHQTYQQQILKLNEEHRHSMREKRQEIDDLIKNRHLLRRGYFDNVLYFIKRIAKRFTRITLFDVNIGSLKILRNILNFVTQAWKRLAGVMIQMLFIDGTHSRAK